MATKLPVSRPKHSQQILPPPPRHLSMGAEYIVQKKKSRVDSAHDQNVKPEDPVLA